MTAVVVFVVTVVLAPVLVGEGVDWLPWVGARLIRQATRRLPLQHRARYEEEWQAEFEALPGGKLTKLAWGLRIYANARKTGAELQVEIDMEIARRAMETAARVLSLAQMTADQAIADARREADETLGRSRREADEVLTKARRHAEQITGDARNRADSLERDAQERHRQAMGSMVQNREELERRIDDLRAFEREYWRRLKPYVESETPITP